DPARPGPVAAWSAQRVEHQVPVDATQGVAVGVVGQGVAEALGADLGDPLVVLVLVVDDRGEHGSGDHGELVGCCDVAGGDGSDAVVDALGDGGSEGTQAVDGRQRAAELLGVGGVHDPVEVGVGTRFGGGAAADRRGGAGGVGGQG